VTTVFELKNVSYSYPGAGPVLKDVSLDLRQGERVVVLGANGSGKSTLLAMLNGLFFPRSGEVRAFGRALTEQTLSEREFGREFRRKVAFVFQNSDVQLFSSTVWEDIAFGPLQLGLPSSRIKEIVEGLLESLRIQDLRDRPPHRLSDGQKKKVAIATSLATDPDVLLLDEPTNGLDPRTQVWLIELLDDLHRKGKTIISATHDLAAAGDISGRAIVFSEDHTVAADGDLGEIVRDEELLLRVNLIHEHAHEHGGMRHVHRHGHFGHVHANGGGKETMHKGHIHDHGHDQHPGASEDLRKLLAMLDHWIEHGDSHADSYREWAEKAVAAGEDEVSREIHLALADNDAVKNHLKRARAILAAKLVLKK